MSNPTDIDYFILRPEPNPFAGWHYVPLIAMPGWIPGDSHYLGTFVKGDPTLSGFLFSSWRVKR